MSAAITPLCHPVPAIGKPVPARWFDFEPDAENWLGLLARLGSGLCPELFGLCDLRSAPAQGMQGTLPVPSPLH